MALQKLFLWSENWLFYYLYSLNQTYLKYQTNQQISSILKIQ